jgi:hypothetical protein
MRAFVLTIMALIGLAACQAEVPEPSVATEQEAISVGQPEVEAEIMPPLCPLRWTCNEEKFYAAKYLCEAQCGPGTCFYTPDCRGNCLCE